MIDPKEQETKDNSDNETQTNQKNNTQFDETYEKTTNELAIEEIMQESSELENAQAEIQKLREQLLRKAAEFENFRRRTREEQESIIKFSNEGLILDLLPIIDDFDRSLKAGIEHPDFESFYTGTELVRNKLMKILEKRGLKTIEVTGKPFDVDYHEAFLQIPREDLDPGTIIDEIEKGYTLHNRVIRHSKVVVAAEASSTES